MDKEMRMYEEQLLKEIEETKLFSFKRLFKVIEYNGLCQMRNK